AVLRSGSPRLAWYESAGGAIRSRRICSGLGSCQPPLRPGDSRTGPAFAQEGTHPERFDPALAVYSQDDAPRHSLYLRPPVRRRRRLRVATTLTLRDPGTPEPGALKRRARE